MAVVIVAVADSDIAPYQSSRLCNRLLQLRVAASGILSLPVHERSCPSHVESRSQHQRRPQPSISCTPTPESC